MGRGKWQEPGQVEQMSFVPPSYDSCGYQYRRWLPNLTQCLEGGLRPVSNKIFLMAKTKMTLGSSLGRLETFLAKEPGVHQRALNLTKIGYLVK